MTVGIMCRLQNLVCPGLQPVSHRNYHQRRKYERATKTATEMTCCARESLRAHRMTEMR
jgi:hypothetical protein